VCQVSGSEPGSSEGSAKIGREVPKRDEGLWRWGFEDALHSGSHLGALLVAIHAKGAGELVGDTQGFDAGVFLNRARDRGGAELVEEIETLANDGEILLPEPGEESFDLVVCGGVGLNRIGFFCWQRYG
jgi:hypothetical protein